MFASNMFAVPPTCGIRHPGHRALAERTNALPSSWQGFLPSALNKAYEDNIHHPRHPDSDFGSASTAQTCPSPDLC